MQGPCHCAYSSRAASRTCTNPVLCCSHPLDVSYRATLRKGVDCWSMRVTQRREYQHLPDATPFYKGFATPRTPLGRATPACSPTAPRGVTTNDPQPRIRLATTSIFSFTGQNSIFTVGLYDLADNPYVRPSHPPRRADLTFISTHRPSPLADRRTEPLRDSQTAFSQSRRGPPLPLEHMDAPWRVASRWTQASSALTRTPVRTCTV